MRILHLTALVALTGGLAAQGAEVGGQPSYQFKEAPFNANGVGSLADLRGAPTIIEFWGTR